MDRIKVLMFAILATMFAACEDNPGSGEDGDDMFSIKCTQTLEGHTDWVYSVCWSPDGTKLASGACDNTVKIWVVK
mgnify:FL=1